MSHAIQTENLTKTFGGGVVAVNNLSLEVRRGAVYGLMGRNGAGKTTLLRLLMGMLRSDRGAARVLGMDLSAANREERSRVAYVSQTHQLPRGMTLHELGRWVQRLNPRWDGAYARRLADNWGVPGSRLIGSLSVGEQRKCAIIVAFAGRPEVLMLDEPAAGFDLVARRELIEQIIDMITQAHECTVLLSTHILADLERIADWIGVIESGRMAMSMRLEDLLNTTKRVQLIFEDDEAPEDLAIPGALQIHRSGSVVNAIVQWTHPGELDLLRGSVDARVQVFPVNLEEVFLELFSDKKRLKEFCVPV